MLNTKRVGKTEGMLEGAMFDIGIGPGQAAKFFSPGGFAGAINLALAGGGVDPLALNGLANPSASALKIHIVRMPLLKKIGNATAFSHVLALSVLSILSLASSVAEESS